MFDDEICYVCNERNCEAGCVLAECEPFEEDLQTMSTCESGEFCWQLKSTAKSIGVAEYSGYCGTCAQEIADQEMAA